MANQPLQKDTSTGKVSGAGIVQKSIWQLTRAMNVIGSVLILGLVVLIGLDVGGRNFFGQPLSGVPEMVGLSIIVIVFLQAPQALQLGRMTRSDTLLNILKKRSATSGRVLETVFDLMGMLVFSIIIYGTWPMLQKAWTRGEFVGAVGDFTAPVWPVRTAVILGSALLTINFAVHIMNRWKGARHDSV